MLTSRQIANLLRQLEDDERRLEATLANVRAQKEKLRELATSSTLTQSLTGVNVNVNKTVTDEHRFNIAKGQKRGDAFLKAITAKGYTQGTLADAIDIKPALLSMYRNGKRPIPRDRAERVEALTGWKATKGHWPGGIVS